LRRNFLFSPMFLPASLEFQFYPYSFRKTFFKIHIFSNYIFKIDLKVAFIFMFFHSY
jgi:hypothetical protein